MTDDLRNHKRLIYSSSPDRGLATLLELWPEIREAEPEAELKIFYGFKNLDMAASASPELATVTRRIRHQVRSLPGVEDCGRVSGNRLAGEMLRAGVWAYPTWFAETSCISAMEAQAAGLYIVTTPVAALNETVADRGVRVPGGWDAPNGPTAAERKAFVDAVVRAIRGEDQPKTREELRAYAREKFGLDSLAKDWDVMLRETLADATDRVVPRFHV